MGLGVVSHVLSFAGTFEWLRAKWILKATFGLQTELVNISGQTTTLSQNTLKIALSLTRNCNTFGAPEEKSDFFFYRRARKVTNRCGVVENLCTTVLGQLAYHTYPKRVFVFENLVPRFLNIWDLRMSSGDLKNSLRIWVLQTLRFEVKNCSCY